VKRAIIVGGGLTGGTVARVLARSCEWSVLVLEKGRLMHAGLGGPTTDVRPLFANDELGYASRHAPHDQDPLLEPRSYRTSPSDGDRISVGEVNNLPTVVGGASTHYDAKLRRFREVDFITNTLMGGTADSPAIPNTSYADWPMQYKHLEPFYAVMEEIIGVQGPAYRGSDGQVHNPNPIESPRSTPFPMPPGVGSFASLLQSDAANRLGYHSGPVPTGITSRPYRGRNACNDCSFCGGVYGCTVNAKSGNVWPLHDAMQTGRVELRPESTVVRIDFSARQPNGRYKATGVEYLDSSGTKHFEAADLVIIANTPIEATRLSLLSGIGSPVDTSNLTTLTPSPTDPSGMLGRNLMFHWQTGALGIVDQPIHGNRGRTNTHQCDDFMGSGPAAANFDPTVPRGGIMEFASGSDPIAEANLLSTAGFGAAFKQVLRTAPLREHLLAIQMQGEDMPQLGNYVDLDPALVDAHGIPAPRVTFSNHPYELAAAEYYAPKMVEIMEAVGGPGSAYPGVKVLAAAAFSNINPSLAGSATSPAQGNISVSRHILGTHRIALDPEHGPCDPFGRYWAFDNLFHSGGGVYVTAAGYNVSLTMTAIAYWTAASILTGIGNAAKYSGADIDAAAARLQAVITTYDSDTMIAHKLAGGGVSPLASACAPAAQVPEGPPLAAVSAAAAATSAAVAWKRFARRPAPASDKAGHGAAVDS
jgi:gluconate 2-dehydrogenase alpha chain